MNKKIFICPILLCIACGGKAGEGDHLTMPYSPAVTSLGMPSPSSGTIFQPEPFDEMRARSAPQTLSFKIKDGRIEFSPSPVLSLSIYEGNESDYDIMLSQQDPVAVVAASGEDCGVAEGACRASPLPLSECHGCDQLKPGKIYRVFFIAHLSQPPETVSSVSFVPSY